jgi:hypothetical protein
MHARHSIRLPPHQPPSTVSATTNLDHPLHIIRHSIPHIQSSILGFIRHGQQPQNTRFVDPNLRGQPRKSSVRGIPAFVYDVDVEVIGLLLEEELGKGPELVGREEQDGRCGFGGECGGGMPGLDLGTEDDGEGGGVGGMEEGADRGVDCVEHLFGDWVVVVSGWRA